MGVFAVRPQVCANEDSYCSKHQQHRRESSQSHLEGRRLFLTVRAPIPSQGDTAMEADESEVTQKPQKEIDGSQTITAEPIPLPGRPGAGTMIGLYQLLQLIGEGGMGEVWLAEQKQPVQRRVAVKLIKAGMDTREVIARFESERQALALMNHPSIAKVFDAGSTPEGR